jgi:PTS system mannose-specific IIA component
MIHIIVVSHGRLAEELVNSAAMIVGEIKDVESLCLFPDDSADSFRQKLDKLVNGLKDQEVLFLVDLHSGTPGNLAAGYLQNTNIECVTGVNLPMLLEAVFLRERVSASELAKKLVDIGAGSIKNLRPLLVNR